MTIPGGLQRFRVECRHASDCSFPIARYGVTAGFFRATGIRIVAGRDFSDDDQLGSEPVAIVSEQAAKYWWLGQSALGKRFKVGGPSSQYPTVTVVGIAANSQPIDEWGRGHGARQPGQYYPVFFQPLTQVDIGPAGHPVWSASLLIGLRSTRDVLRPEEVLRSAIRRIAPRMAVSEVASLASIQMASGPFQRVRTSAAISEGACILAVLLALAGTAALVAEGIRARIREFGIRLAIGATPVRLRRMALADVARVSAVAIAAGLAASWFLRTLVSRVFYGTAPQVSVERLYGIRADGWPTAAAACVILTMLLAATGWVATRPLVRMDPASVLRQD